MWTEWLLVLLTALFALLCTVAVGAVRDHCCCRNTNNKLHRAVASGHTRRFVHVDRRL